MTKRKAKAKAVRGEYTGGEGAGIFWWVVATATVIVLGFYLVN